MDYFACQFGSDHERMLVVHGCYDVGRSSEYQAAKNITIWSMLQLNKTGQMVFSEWIWEDVLLSYYAFLLFSSMKCVVNVVDKS